MPSSKQRASMPRDRQRLFKHWFRNNYSDSGGESRILTVTNIIPVHPKWAILIVNGIVIRSGQATEFAQVSWNMCGSIVIKEK